MVLSHCFLWKDPTIRRVRVHTPTHSLGQSPTVTVNFPYGNRPSSCLLCSPSLFSVFFPHRLPLLLESSREEGSGGR